LKPLKDIEVIQGNNLELICEASGTPAPIAQWLRKLKKKDIKQYYE
jgi:hypothetical protein